MSGIQESQEDQSSALTARTRTGTQLEGLRERVKSLLKYREDGHLIWMVNSKVGLIGKPAGVLNKRTGYRVMSLDNKTYLVHRLIWLLHHGYLPKQIDHINRIKTDNRIENMRGATPSENVINTGLRKDNTSGCKGVSFCSIHNKWVSKIVRNNRVYHIGYFRSKEEAINARSLREDLFGR
jgi:hypothetical protein